MSSRPYLVLLAVVLGIGVVQAARPNYQIGVVTRIERKAHDRTLYYLVNTPVMTEDPYYEISVRVQDIVYVGEYALRNSEDELPFAWKPGDEVRVQIEKSHMLVERPSGGSLKMVIEKHFTVQPPKALDRH